MDTVWDVLISFGVTLSVSRYRPYCTGLIWVITACHVRGLKYKQAGNVLHLLSQDIYIYGDECVHACVCMCELCCVDFKTKVWTLSCY